jgi:NitT/TauT family transport system substrate-binding protein
LKGRKVGIPEGFGSSGHLLLAIMVAHVGLDPHSDIEWTVTPTGDLLGVFAEGQVDAFLAFPPEPQELRAREVGRVILNTATDKPWSRYFCCMVVGNREFINDHPRATKRVLRAILKANDICAAAPEAAARRLVDAGFTKRYDYALQTLTELPYASWREFDPEDAMRFYALRLHEVDMIKSSPNALIAEGTDWRFLNELKRELKA